MIPFVDFREPRIDVVSSLLEDCRASGTWTNFGPVSTALETRAAALLGLPEDRAFVACSSGTSALHALVNLYEHRAKRTLRWIVSAFTFAAQHQGPLAGARVTDCDSFGFLSIEEVERMPSDSYDGIVVTNLFGTARNVEQYERIAERGGKILLFDSATCFASTYSGRPFGRQGSAEIFSFHHTKPCGFGEGGGAVVPSPLESTFRSLINFGLYEGIDTGSRSTNAKMSDVAAAFILDHLRHLETIRLTHVQQFRRIGALAREIGLRILIDEGGEGWIPSLVPIVFTSPVQEDLSFVKALRLHKYYRPIIPLPHAQWLYERIVCFPCHGGVAHLSDDSIRAIIAALARS